MKKKIITILLIILFVFVVIAGIVALRKTNQDSDQEEKLREEASTLNGLMNAESLDIDKINEMLDRTVTTGDYAVVEKALKDYCRDGLNSLNSMLVVMEDEKMINMLTPENYKNDGPEFEETKKYIKESRETLETEKEKLLRLLEKDEILKYINDKNLSDEFKKLYEEVVQIDVNMEEEKTGIDQSITMMVELLNSAEKIIDFLKENKNDWEVVDNQLTFTSEELSNEYNEMIENFSNF